MGLLLAPPALSGEFYPDSLWHRVERLPVPPVRPRPHPCGLRAAFTDSVTELTANANIIGVSLSGGLDSLATLIHACKVADGRQVIAFNVNLTDDQGVQCAPFVAWLLKDLGLTEVRLEVIDPDEERAEPAWSPLGPRLDALPEVNAAVSRRAAQLGVDILLSGDGADELLGVPRYATAEIARRFGPRAAARYAEDVAHSGLGLAGEAAAATARLLPATSRARAYWAANWPDWCDPRATAVLADPYRDRATRWSQAWVAQRIEDHATQGRSWAQADAHDAFWPHELIGAAGEVPEASPFLTDTFLAAAFSVPLAERYGQHLPTGYWRCKALVLSLLPQDAWLVLPRQKQYFRTALARYAAAKASSAPLLSELGLINPDQLRKEEDTAVRLIVPAIERWLTGALAQGAEII
ncbi:asparagine synthase-related protein (plasmid) [Streptomyces sp. DSM 116496]|uniref:asparagine synthase-related protein n=1 Tax=Streptomyces stoeckheimensis TaxID=3344656 RepID=UPI0038B3FF5D